MSDNLTRLEGAIIRVVKLYPFYGWLLQSMPRAESSQVGTIGVTIIGGKPSLIYSRAFLDALDPEMFPGLLVHEIEHILRKHISRRFSRERTLWNVATDAAINGEIREHVKLPLPEGGVYPEMIPGPVGLAAEEYYAILFEEMKRAVAKAEAEEKRRQEEDDAGDDENSDARNSRSGGDDDESDESGNADDGDGESNADRDDESDSGSGASRDDDDDEPGTRRRTGSGDKSTGDEDTNTGGGEGERNDDDDEDDGKGDGSNGAVSIDELEKKGNHGLWGEAETLNPHTDPDAPLDVNDMRLGARELTQIEQKALDKTIEDMVRDAFEKSRGVVPAHLGEIVAAILSPPVIPWQDELRKFTGKLKSVLRKFTYLRLSRFYDGKRGTIRRKKLALLVAVDASGSIGDAEFGAFMGQVRYLIGDLAMIYTLQFDAAIQRLEETKFITPQIVRGARGGTDFAPAVRYAAGILEETDFAGSDPRALISEASLIYQRNPWDAMICLTDGCAPDPGITRVPTLWVTTTEAAPWSSGAVIHVSREQLLGGVAA